MFVKHPGVSGAATSASFAVTHSAGTTAKTVNQTLQAGTWVSLGSFSFTQGNTAEVVLSDNAAGGTVLTDAAKLVRAGGVTVVVVTHFMGEAEHLCDRVAVLDRGRVLALDTPRALTADAGAATLEDAFLASTGRSLLHPEEIQTEEIR